MDIGSLQERRAKVVAERDSIQDKINKAQAVIQEANSKIPELVGLLNVNSGVLSEIDFNIKSLKSAEVENAEQVKEEANALQ